jgi:hypothetical protein
LLEGLEEGPILKRMQRVVMDEDLNRVLRGQPVRGVLDLRPKQAETLVFAHLLLRRIERGWVIHDENRAFRRIRSKWGQAA